MGQGNKNTSTNSTKERYCKECKLHGKKSPRKHNCPYKDCQQTLCTVTRIQREVLRKQQGIWRSKDKQGVRTEKDLQLCDNCRNHGVSTHKKGHNNCRFADCEGMLCQYGKRRRQIYRFMTRIDRNQITCDQFEEIATLYRNKKSSALNIETHKFRETSSKEPKTLQPSGVYGLDTLDHNSSGYLKGIPQPPEVNNFKSVTKENTRESIGSPPPLIPMMSMDLEDCIPPPHYERHYLSYKQITESSPWSGSYQGSSVCLDAPSFEPLPNDGFNYSKMVTKVTRSIPKLPPRTDYFFRPWMSPDSNV